VDLSNVEKVLELIEWPEDIDTKKGRERFQYAIRSFRNLDFPQKKYVILEELEEVVLVVLHSQIINGKKL
jgi:hypothetical protein